MKVRIEGMSCSGCSARVEKALRSLSGIQEVQVDLADNSASYSGAIDQETVRDAIEGIGYDVKGFEN